MPWIELPETDDAKLEDLAPDFLKGDRKTTSRVRWAIDRLFQLATPAPPVATQESSVPESSD